MIPTFTDIIDAMNCVSTPILEISFCKNAIHRVFSPEHQIMISFHVGVTGGHPNICRNSTKKHFKVSSTLPVMSSIVETSRFK